MSNWINWRWHNSWGKFAAAVVVRVCGVWWWRRCVNMDSSKRLPSTDHATHINAVSARNFCTLFDFNWMECFVMVRCQLEIHSFSVSLGGVTWVISGTDFEWCAVLWRRREECISYDFRSFDGEIVSRKFLWFPWFDALRCISNSKKSTNKFGSKFGEMSSTRKPICQEI